LNERERREEMGLLSKKKERIFWEKNLGQLSNFLDLLSSGATEQFFGVK